MLTKKLIIPVIIAGSAFLFFGASNNSASLMPNDALDGRIFNVNITEVKDGQNSNKTIPDEMIFRKGKFFSNFMNEKLKLGQLKYRINKDSVYMDENNVEVQYYEIEISISDKADVTTTVICRIEDYDIDGEIKQTKNDKPKKSFVFNGKEKPTKKKPSKS